MGFDPSSESEGSGTCEKIDPRSFLGDPKCILTSQTSFIGVLNDKFLNPVVVGADGQTHEDVLRHGDDQVGGSSPFAPTTLSRSHIGCSVASGHAKSTNTGATPRAQIAFRRRQRKCLLVRSEEKVVGRVRHEDLLAHVAGD